MSSLAVLINTALVLAVIGVILYLIEKLPMDDVIRLLIRVVVIVTVMLYLARTFLPGVRLL